MSEPTPKTPRHGAPQPPPLRELPWQARINASTLSLLGFIILALASLGVLGGSGRSLDTWGNLTRFIGRFFPPDLSVVDDALAAIGETVQIATMATPVLDRPLAPARRGRRPHPRAARPGPRGPPDDERDPHHPQPRVGPSSRWQSSVPIRWPGSSP